MNIRFNGEGRDVAGETLGNVLVELGYAGALIATAVNGRFVPATARDLTILKPGDTIEVVAPLQGG
jgi:sulfur carrier protein